MAIDFPSNPSTNYVFTDPTSSKSWKWDGEKWINATTLTTNDLPDSIITNSKLASSSVTAPKLSTATSGITGEYLTRNTGATSGFEWTTRVSTHSVLNSSFSTVTVSNTTAETNLISYSLSGIAANDIVKIRAWGTAFNNTANSYTYTFKFKIGTTTVLTSAAITSSSSDPTFLRRWMLDLSIYNPTLSSQHVTVFMGISSLVSNNWSALTTASGAVPSTVGMGTSTEDLSTAKTIALTVQNSAASASFNWVQTGYVIEKFS